MRSAWAREAAQSHLQSHSFYPYRYKAPKGAGARFWMLSRLWPPLDIPALNRPAHPVAVAMGEHLRSDSAGCSTQIDSAPVALRRRKRGDMQIVFRCGPLLVRDCPG